MKRVGRWTWMLLTLLLLLCTTAFAKTIECGSIELEQPVEVTLEDRNTLRYTLTAPIDGMRVQVEWLTENKDYISLKVNGDPPYNKKSIYKLEEHGEKTIDLSAASSAELPLTVRFVLHEYRNDEQEPNDMIPSELHDGDSVKFVLDSGDTDRFTITTEKPGQDIALTFSGFNYADRTSFYLNWDGKQEIKKNGTVFLHTGEPGAYQFSLYMSGDGEISRSMEIHLLDGDENELNDTKETATPLPIGTDAAFSIGGIGDADWFSFEAVPEEGQSKFYTLRLLNVEPGKTEEITYKVYAPDGTVVASEVISPRHSRILSCSQQGQYTIKLSAKGSNIQRVPLRIRVEEGGDDPYESNDTWLDAAYIEPGQLISHVLPSGDADWFCFTVPEDHMTLHVSSDCKGIQAMVYIGQTLAEYGDKARVIWSENTSRGKSAENLYWKLGEKGLYYIKLIGGSSEAIRSTTISLIPPEAIENNDAWNRATPLYEDVTQAFDISAYNDTDWFCFTVPEGAPQTLLLNFNTKTELLNTSYSEYVYVKLYPKAYFENQAGMIESDEVRFGQKWNPTRFQWNLDPGIYYMQVKSRNMETSWNWADILKLNVCWKLIPRSSNNSIAAAVPLTEKVWQDVWRQWGYFSIGEHKAGEVVQIQRDEGENEPKNNIYVYDANGKSIASSDYASFSFRIPADGVYFLKIPEFDIHLNAENEPMRTMRIRYYTHNDKIGAAESIAMRPNESVFLDLWFSPEISSRLEVESEDEALTYDSKTGYLTAPNTPEGSADLVFSNGYPEGDERRIEAVTHVIWSENPLSDISISNAPQSLPVGSSVQLEAAVTPDDYIGRVSWESSDPSVLRVLSNGKVVAVGQGEAVITASIGEATSSVTITVTGEQPGESGLTGVSLDRYTLTLYAGEEAEQLTATLKPEGTEATIRWTSSNQTAATVSQDGKITPLSAGVTVVTAAAGDYRASCIVTVQPERVRVTGIRFEETTHTLMMGSTVTLQPIIAPDDATVKNLTWVSSDEQTATVSRTGIVTALSVGETTITATTVDGGYSAEIKIIVTAAAQLGDVNGDGYIDAADALLCLRASVGLITLTPEQEAAADVNHDGLIDAGDAILILRYDARLIPSLN